MSEQRGGDRRTPQQHQAAQERAAQMAALRERGWKKEQGAMAEWIAQEFAEWIAQQQSEVVACLAQVVACFATELEVALEQFLEMAPVVTQATDRERSLEAQIRAQEERLNCLDQALRELAAIVGFDAWQRIGAIITGNSEEGGDE